ncbi:5'-3' DNA helicase ZGRF1-like isoform X2 [Mytilus trossulus]|uniref:5'-3' DNA helicase ZGRF1-like isoform X1 n=1 Tax=Mytilus trossulus TaxID=6551 RepID=UPI003006F966
MKIPLVSAPDDILAENDNSSSVNKSKSHDDGGQPALFDTNLLQDKSDVDNGCSINVAVVPNISESNSDMSSPSLTYWENKLIQRQKCGNIFIKNDQDSLQSSSKNWETKHKSYHVKKTENSQCKNQYENSSGPYNSSAIRFSNSVTQNQVQHRDRIRHDEQGNESYKINFGGNSFDKSSTVNPETETRESDNIGSKWGKYAEFDDEDDDFLTFDQSFSVPVVTDQSETPTTSLRPWTKHNDTFNGDESLVVPEITDQKEKPVISLGSWTKHHDTFNEDKSLVVPEMTDQKEKPVISLGSWTKCNESFGMPNMSHQAEKHTISLQPAKRHSDTFDFSDLNPLGTITESQSYNKNECVTSSQKFQSTSRNKKEQFQSRHISEKQYLSPNNQNLNQNTQSTITRTNSPNFSHGNPSRNISEKQYLSPANRYQIASKQISQSTITRTNSPNFSYGNPSNVESTSVTCVTPTDNYNPGKKFKCPVPQLTSSMLKGTKRNLGSDLQFPSIQEITENSQLVREMEIPTRFTSLSNYKQVFTAALKEHLNIILFDLGVKYHHALSKIDTTSYLPTVPGKENKGTVNSNPVCKCGAPSKMIQVKKSGPNHNRFFYACNAARNSQCKFFQWSDEKGGGHNKKGGIDKQTMSDPTSIFTFIRSHHVYFYCDCTFIKKSQENIMTHFRRNTPNWVKQRMGMDITGKKKMYIQLSKKDNSGLYSKDDLWIISRHLDFRPSSTVLCKSTYYGPTSGNEVEIEPIASFCPSNWSNGEKCHAILAGNVSGELSYLVNLEENVTITDVPVLQSLLACNTERSSSTFSAPLKVSENTNIYVPESYVDEKVEELIDQYKLNEDQSTALIRVARMFTDREKDILLIHGVFGAGKSFLLSVVVVFLVWLFERNDTYTPGVPFPWKLLIASTTNVAVDRILNGLLAIGFEEFVRVGSVKKISKPILPFSVHATGSDSQELKDLQMMLRSGELTATEKQNVKQSIEKHKLGENKKKLSKVRVVGVTCASCSANTLKDMKFPIVLLDECSQMTEPASMLPVAKFKCQKLVLVGDPKQLDPTIQGSETSTVHGLEQTLFDRITLMGHSPVMLHTQYRCHPYISQVSNSLFYNNVLRNGIAVEDREPVMDELPALCFYDVCDGLEINDRDGSFYNDKEAEFIIFLIEVLVDREVDPDRIGVISLYKSQMYKITNLLGSNKNCKELKGVMVSTVDAFQGGERDVIILSCVRTRNVGFIDNQKRTNVALTRAKHHLLIVGNENNLTKNKLWHQIIQQCKDSSPQGLQSADIIRERFKLEPKPTESSQKKKRNHNNQFILTDDASSSPPMSLTDSCKSSLSTDSSNIQQLVPEPVSFEKGDQCSEEMDFKVDLTNQVPGRRRKRRKIDPSLLEDDENINSDDEELPNIFNS